MNVALPLVVAGAVADGVLVELGELVEGDVDCAIALVNARPLTAATAMMFLNMYASCQALCRNRFRVAGGSRPPWEATREPECRSRSATHSCRDSRARHDQPPQRRRRARAVTGRHGPSRNRPRQLFDKFIDG